MDRASVIIMVTMEMPTHCASMCLLEARCLPHRYQQAVPQIHHVGHGNDVLEGAAIECPRVVLVTVHRMERVTIPVLPLDSLCLRVSSAMPRVLLLVIV